MVLMATKAARTAISSLRRMLSGSSTPIGTTTGRTGTTSGPRPHAGLGLHDVLPVRLSGQREVPDALDVDHVEEHRVEELREEREPEQPGPPPSAPDGDHAFEGEH